MYVCGSVPRGLYDALLGGPLGCQSSAKNLLVINIYIQAKFQPHVIMESDLQKNVKMENRKPTY